MNIQQGRIATSCCCPGCRLTERRVHFTVMLYLVHKSTEKWAQEKRDGPPQLHSRVPFRIWKTLRTNGSFLHNSRLIPYCMCVRAKGITQGQQCLCLCNAPAMWPSWNGCTLPHSLSLSHPSLLDWKLSLSPPTPLLCQMNPPLLGERQRFYFRRAELLVLGWVPWGRSPWQPLAGDNHVFQRMEEEEEDVRKDEEVRQ